MAVRLLAAMAIIFISHNAHAQSPRLFSPGWFGAAASQGHAAGSLPGSATTPATLATAPQVQQSLADFAKAAAAISHAQAVQSQASAAAAAASQNVPDGLGSGGLLPDLANWSGAAAPAQSNAGAAATVTVQQTVAQAFLTWNSFNVGPHTTLAFDQSAGGTSASSWTVLNRVNASASPSQILGRITAQGEVLVIDPNGIIFGAGAQVNVGLVAGVHGGPRDHRRGRRHGLRDVRHLRIARLQRGDQRHRRRTRRVARLQCSRQCLEQWRLRHTIRVERRERRCDQHTRRTDDPGRRPVIHYAAGLWREHAADFDHARHRSRGNRRRRATNTGLIQSATGDITMVGQAVTQAGVAYATTSVAQRGTIHLLTDASDPTTSVTLAPGSVTAILPDTSGATATDAQRATLIAEIERLQQQRHDGVFAAQRPGAVAGPGPAGPVPHRDHHRRHGGFRRLVAHHGDRRADRGLSRPAHFRRDRCGARRSGVGECAAAGDQLDAAGQRARLPVARLARQPGQRRVGQPDRVCKHQRSAC